jgi:hypothetical protein
MDAGSISKFSSKSADWRFARFVSPSGNSQAYSRDRYRAGRANDQGTAYVPCPRETGESCRAIGRRQEFRDRHSWHRLGYAGCSSDSSCSSKRGIHLNDWLRRASGGARCCTRFYDSRNLLCRVPECLSGRSSRVRKRTRIAMCSVYAQRRQQRKERSIYRMSYQLSCVLAA